MILGINNRTENWKTARVFAPYFRKPDSLLRLADRLGETKDTKACDVHIELFWKGTRDYLHSIENRTERDRRRKDLLENSKNILLGIRCKILAFENFRNLKCDNYAVVPPEGAKKLLNNLYNTEIDIVIETPKKLYIGEAKHEADFGSDSRLVLVHQLIRQYVMAQALLEALGSKKQVIPFIVGPDAAKLKERGQVRFMLEQCWLKESNVLNWKEVALPR